MSCCGLDSVHVKGEGSVEATAPKLQILQGGSRSPAAGEVSCRSRSGWGQGPGADSQARNSFLSHPGLGLSKMVVSFPSARSSAVTLDGSRKVEGREEHRLLSLPVPAGVPDWDPHPSARPPLPEASGPGIPAAPGTGLGATVPPNRNTTDERKEFCLSCSHARHFTQVPRSQVTCPGGFHSHARQNFPEAQVLSLPGPALRRGL